MSLWITNYNGAQNIEAMPFEVRTDTDVYLTCHHSDLALSFTLGSDQRVTKRPRSISEQAPLAPFQAAILSDVPRLETMRDAISSTLTTLGDSALVLDLSDFSLCGILAAFVGAKGVVSLGSSTGALPVLSAWVAQIANRLSREGCTGVPMKFCNATAKTCPSNCSEVIQRHWW